MLKLKDHAMLLVGYGKDNATGEDIWLIKKFLIILANNFLNHEN